MEDAAYNSSPPRHSHIPRLKGFLPLNDESPMALHNAGVLNSLIRTRSNTSLHRLRRAPSIIVDDEEVGERLSWRWDSEESPQMRRASSVLYGPQMRSMRLIGNSNPRYNWTRYWKTEEELKLMKQPIRQYYERTNLLIQQYIYIDRLLDSSLPHDLLNEYNTSRDQPSVPATISEEQSSNEDSGNRTEPNGVSSNNKKIKRTPRDLFKVPSEDTALLEYSNDEDSPRPEIPGMSDDSVESGDRIVQLAIYVNLAANIFLLGGKMAVIVLTSSLSVLASLVDGALDLLSTGIVWTTTRLIARQDRYRYPVGRRRLEPIGVLVFSVIMVTCFFQVALECFNRLNSGDHSIIQLGVPSIAIMASTVVIKALCWLWCRVIKNSSVQALAQDAETDVIFNLFSIIFPLVGYYANLWWLDGLGGLLLSGYVIVNWAGTSAGHIRNLTGAAATADERNVLLYLTMRFAKTIKQIQGLEAYHSGDKLNVEVDIVLDETTSLRDSHDLGESLQYVLESVPTVDRAFVHQDYASWNLPSHMQQQAE
ncbi:hypothetical protein VC83_06923 [Pseudogymnoascus destructans]|uniref:Cation efflux protein transmembrane domain-containing protein n=2 Tax=Pseudogymnoascus destructans TaxID=655981 RepID=L8FUJ3_PSED2|nr:uncharacterized protein VC83_06923 [Pseudogymnoascus destructans]ELR03421.1 hypothetical protein GMDG_06158 [Pseudogymnoascus destructans 20631-21]OAF56725.1 hypothetical protein VC83_06923 [Pseudogymnoascus destructans]